MSEKPEPPYRCAFDDLADYFKNVNKYKPASGGFLDSYKERKAAKIHALLNGEYFKPLNNQEKPMNNVNIDKLTPGDKVRFNLYPIKPKHKTNFEYLVFLGRDPQQPEMALVRDCANVSAAVRTVHKMHLYVMPPKEHVAEMMVIHEPGRGAQLHRVDQGNMGLLNNLIVKHLIYKAIDADVTADGLVLVKYVEEKVDEDALRAAYEDPTTDFRKPESPVKFAPGSEQL